MVTYSYPIQMEIAGQTAIWVRPDSGDSPISYAAPTYSAVKLSLIHIFVRLIFHRLFFRCCQNRLSHNTKNHSFAKRAS